MAAFEFVGGEIRPLGEPKAEEVTIYGGVPLPRAIVAAPAVDVVDPPVAKVQKNVAPSAPLQPKDVIRLARARLREIERDLKKMKSLEKEREQLRLMLSAVDGPKRPEIRLARN